MFSTRGLSRYNDRVLMPTICCLYKCSNLEELYLEMADSPAITTYLLAHTLKHLNCVRVLALPKQCKQSCTYMIPFLMVTVILLQAMTMLPASSV